MAGRKGGERIRAQRVSEQIRMDVADILQNEVKDPRLKRLTCTRVDLTGDLRYAKVYVSMMEEGAERDGTMAALERATGFVRRTLSRRLGLRVSPEIHFLFDPSVEYSIRLESLLEENRLRRPEDLDDDEPSSEPPSER